jgi:hypothetical protein
LKIEILLEKNMSNVRNSINARIETKNTQSINLSLPLLYHMVYAKNYY